MPTKWKISFFDPKGESKTLHFPAGILANLLHILQMIEEFGPALGALTQYRWVVACLRFEPEEKKVLGARYFALLKTAKL